MTKKSILFKSLPIIDGRDFSNYKVSNRGGLIYNKKKDQLMLTPLSNCNYPQVCIRDQFGKAYVQSVGHLVALVWVENEDPEHYKEVDHIDGNKNNNDADNLRWTDRKGNLNNPITLAKRKEKWQDPEWKAQMIKKLREGRDRYFAQKRVEKSTKVTI